MSDSLKEEIGKKLRDPPEDKEGARLVVEAIKKFIR
jgi:hypothetical protein